MGRSIWNIESCANEAKKYKYISQFIANASGAYKFAKKNNLIETFTWFQDSKDELNKWTFERCEELARQCKTSSEFYDRYPCAYNASSRKGFLKQFDWLEKERVGCTKEECVEAAKKCKSRGEFSKKYVREYSYALKHKILDEFTWFSKSKTMKKWTFDTCSKESKKYSTTGEFHRENAGAYAAAIRNGWIDKFTWLERSSKPKGYWTKELCEEESKKYKTMCDFHDYGGGAYVMARDNGWLDDYTWLERLVAKRGYYTEDVCLNEAKKYSTLKDFRNNARKYYEQSKSNGWLDNYTWLKRENVKKGHWTMENCAEESKKYRFVQEFRSGSPYVYSISLENGWLPSFTWLEDRKCLNAYKKVDNVYVYVFDKQKTVYVGRTVDLKARHRAHTRYNRKDSVGDYIKEIGLKEPPEMIVLEKDISLYEGLKKENEWLNHYISLGYTPINKHRTGVESGSIGGLGPYRTLKKERFKEDIEVEHLF